MTQSIFCEISCEISTYCECYGLGDGGLFDTNGQLEKGEGVSY